MSLPSSARRILRDLKQWKECGCEVPTITAWPLENNIYEWHANMMANDGPLKGVRFHLIINFPKDYPYSPPAVELCNYLKHPNVFKTGVHGNTKSNNGYWICLDMLKEYTRSNKYQGWTSAYNVVSLLLQLQSFLIGNKIEQDSGRIVELQQYLTNDIIKNIKNESNKFKCSKCNDKTDYFDNNKIKTINNADDDYKEYQGKVTKNKQYLNYWSSLYDDVENEIMSYLTYADCIYFNCVCKQFRKIIARNKIFELKRFGCWYHKIDLKYCQKTLDEYKLNNIKNNDDDEKIDNIMNIKHFEDTNVLNNMILGYGFTPKFYSKLSNNNKRYFGDYLGDIEEVTISKHEKSLKFLRLQSCEITSDLLSFDAFNKHHIRSTVWKDKNFTHFLPIYINNKHGLKSMKLFEEICLNIFIKESKQHYGVIVPEKYHPMMGIHLIMSIMASLVVSVTKNCDGLSGNNPDLYYSINIIETYMHLYHMLLAIYNKYNNMISEIINLKCASFVYDEHYRTKQYVPNFGTFKLYFILQDRYKWNDIVQSFVDEAFIRKVKWVVNDYSSLRTVELNEDKDYRINKTWKVSKKRGFMFQYFFLNYCCKIGIKSPLNTFKAFNNNFGCPPKHLPLQFQKFVKKIYSVNSIYEFFDIIQIKNTNKEYVYNLLANACNKSLKNGYHQRTARRRRRYWY